MIDLYLKADSKERAHRFLLANGFACDTDTGVLYYTQPAGAVLLDDIGAVYRPTGKTITGQLGEYPELVEVPGHHFNLRVIDHSLADKFRSMEVKPTPKTPSRVWA